MFAPIAADRDQRVDWRVWTGYVADGWLGVNRSVMMKEEISLRRIGKVHETLLIEYDLYDMHLYDSSCRYKQSVLRDGYVWLG